MSSSDDDSQRSAMSAQSARALAQLERNKVADKTMRPKFLKLFPQSVQNAVIAKLVAYHTRIGTDLFLGLTDVVMFRMVVDCKFPGHHRIPSYPTFSKVWKERDISRFGDLTAIYPEYRRLQLESQKPSPPTPVITSAETQTDQALHTA